MIARTLRSITAALLLVAAPAHTVAALSPQQAVAAQAPVVPVEAVFEEGGGWYERAICIGCLVGAGVGLYSGAAVWAMLVASPGTTLAAVSICFAACDAAYGET